MPSSDIYQTKESQQEQKQEAPKPSSRRRRRRKRSTETFDEAVGKDISKTHKRRHKNSGFRRLRHLLKKPEFSKKFWGITLSVAGVLLTILVLWDFFFRYPNSAPTDPVDPMELQRKKLNSGWLE